MAHASGFLPTSGGGRDIVYLSHNREAESNSTGDLVLNSISAVQTRDWLTIASTQNFTLSVGQYRVLFEIFTGSTASNTYIDGFLNIDGIEKKTRGQVIAGFNSYSWIFSVSDDTALHFCMLSSETSVTEYRASQIQIEKLT